MQRIRLCTAIGTAVSTVAAYALLGGLTVASAALEGNDHCAVSVDPMIVKISSETVTVTATPSESIGSLVSVDIDARSAAVLEVADAEGHDESISLVLDLAGARPGTWKVKLRGLTGECEGKIAIEDGATYSKR